MPARTGDTSATMEELHVAGVLVHVVAGQAAALKAWLEALPGTYVHGATEAKLVVTLEADSTAEVAQLLERIRSAPGVLSALPVYQHNEPAAGIDEEESYGNSND